jgi:phosphoenolpyruvate carboxykinase (ATP)
MAKLEGPTYIIEAKSFLVDPPQDELQRLTEKMPNARKTKYGNLNVTTRVDARSSKSTFIVNDDPKFHPQTMTRAQYEEIVERQEAYIREQDMVVINGFIGDDPDFRVPARLVIEAANANIAGSQDLLYFKGDEGEFTEPAVTIIYTPNLEAPGYPLDRCIAVDLDNGVTRVLNSDYFGESKKGGLRMWNKIVYDRGGLPLHAGCKEIPVGDDSQTFLIIGLSGTGKTTTTFTRQNDSKPVQDDFVALMPGGAVHGTENGCFAKTFAINPDHEPTIYKAVTSPGSYLENVSQDDDGELDFYDESFTANGRAVFGMEKLGWFTAPKECGQVQKFLILNRNNNIIPAVARLTKEQAAAYFMLGETMGTAAGGKDEAGKSLRVPGTNPFFPMQHALQGNRFHELLQTADMEVYLLNTGWIGGGDGEEHCKKVSIPVSSAVVKAIAEGTVTWETDPDFSYEIASSLPGVDDEEFLQPRKLYERTNRNEEYVEIVERLKKERTEFLSGFEGLKSDIVAAIS